MATLLMLIMMDRNDQKYAAKIWSVIEKEKEHHIRPASLPFDQKEFNIWIFNKC